MDERERLFRALDREPVDRVPCASPLQTGIVELMERSGSWWPAAHHVPSLMARLALSAHELAGLESVRVPFDVSVDASAFGAVTGLEAVDRQPSVLNPSIHSLDWRDDLPIPDPWRAGRAPVVLSALGKLANETTPLIGGIVGPFMLAGQLRGTKEAIMDVVLDPGGLKRLLSITSRWGIAYAKAALEAGADIITVIDATSSGDVLSPGQYAEFALPFQAEVVREVRNRGGRAVLHICGDTARNLPLMLRTDAHGISLDQQMDLGSARALLDGKAALIGNVSPTSTLLFKGPSEVADEVRGCIEAGTDVVAPGCGFAPQTPLANMMAMVKATKMSGQHHRARSSIMPSVRP